MNAPNLVVLEPRRARISSPSTEPDSEQAPRPIRALYKPDVEKALIGAILLDPAEFPRAAAIVQAGDFANFWHGMVWYAFESLFRERKPIDIITASDALKAIPNCPIDPDYMDRALIEFESACRSTSQNAAAWAEIVWETAQRIRLIQTFESLIKASYDDRKPIEDLTARTYRDVAAAIDMRQRQPTVTDGLNKLMSELDFVMQGGAYPLIPTTIPAIDRMIGGFRQGEVAILAGDSGMGKTTLLLSIIVNLLQMGIPVTLFSIEMDMGEVLSAMLAIMTGISRKKIRERAVSREDYVRLADARATIDTLPFRMDTSTRLTPADLRLRLMRFNLEAPLGLVVVDGLWKMTGDKPFYTDGARGEVSEISEALNAIAKDEQLSTPAMLVTHQYKDAPRTRKDKRPMMHDLAESSAVRRDMQVVFGLYNEAYYGEGRGVSSGSSELHLLKMRNASPPREAAWLHYEGERYVFGK